MSRQSHSHLPHACLDIHKATTMGLKSKGRRAPLKWRVIELHGRTPVKKYLVVLLASAGGWIFKVHTRVASPWSTYNSQIFETRQAAQAATAALCEERGW